LPDQTLVRELEDVLAKQSCIGSLNKWDRTYFHSYEVRRLGVGASSNTNVLTFAVTLPSNRPADVDQRERNFADQQRTYRATEPNPVDAIGDRYDRALGWYDAKVGGVWMEVCGPVQDGKYTYVNKVIARRDASGKLVPVS
jgi:hypothetical protein